MQTLKIKELTMRGFKNSQGEKSYTLGQYTQITGDNAQGKTTIGEAIAWTLLGTTLAGNDKADSSLVNDSLDSMECAIKYEDENGEHEVIRSKKSAVSVKLDGTKVSQTKLNAEVFNKDIFLSVFNPSYFPNLDPTPARNLLVRILPRVSNEEVLSSLDKLFAEKLTKYSSKLIDTNGYLKELRASLRKTEDDKTRSTGSIESKRTMLAQIVVPNELNFDNVEISGLKDNLEVISELKPSLVDVSTLLEERAKVREEIALLNSKKVELEDTKNLQIEVSELRGQYKSLNTQLKETYKLGDFCHCCNQPISEEHQATITMGIVEKLSDIEEMAKNKTNTITEIENRNKKIEENFLKELEIVRNRLVQKLSSLDTSEIEKQNHKATEDFERSVSSQKDSIKARMIELEAEQKKVDQNNMQRAYLLQQKTTLDANIQTESKDIQKFNASMKEYNILISAVQSFNSKYIDILTKKIEQHLGKVSIVIQEIKDGEIKECFRLFYEGREYKVLSNSEKIRVGIEIANLIMNCLNIKCPIFIDNAESISDYCKPDTQIIESSVVKGQTHLIVNC
jgi:DNA repair exonuclease SbcCD ATPase subunit